MVIDLDTLQKKNFIIDKILATPIENWKENIGVGQRTNYSQKIHFKDQLREVQVWEYSGSCGHFYITGLDLTIYDKRANNLIYELSEMKKKRYADKEIISINELYNNLI